MKTLVFLYYMHKSREKFSREQNIVFLVKERKFLLIFLVFEKPHTKKKYMNRKEKFIFLLIFF